MSSSVAMCQVHVWERHLEVHKDNERVIRVCVNCGRREMCWEQQRRKRATPRRCLTARDANSIELIVDGDIVDLNRIPFPSDGSLIDERFKGGKSK
jgi:hypothetical protein